MKLLLQFCVLLLFVSFNLHAQDFNQKFGRVSKTEFELIKYDRDTTAEAVVLFDLGKSSFIKSNNTFDILFERTTRIKIFSEAGYKWSEVEIPYYHEGDIYEHVFDIEAHTFNMENGMARKTDLDISNAYDEKVNEYWMVRKFALPDIKAGSIIEYRYKIQTQYIFNLRDWDFQWRIPVLYSEYFVEMIPFYEYSMLLQGSNRFDYRTSYVDRGADRYFGTVKFKDTNYQFVMKDLPAFREEDFISSANDYIIKLDFQLAKVTRPDGSSFNIITTWPELIKELIKHDDFGKHIKKSEKFISKIPVLENILKKSPHERFEKIMDYAKNNLNWDNNNRKFASKSAKNLFDDKYGTSADINLFVIGLLRAAEIETYPVILSTRNHGKIRNNYPYSHFFNYVAILANINGKKILCDATEINNSNLRLPPRCINDKGLVIKKDELEWVDLTCDFPSTLITEILMDLSDLRINASISNSADEYMGLHYRNMFNDIGKTKEILTGRGYNVIDSTLAIGNHNTIDKPVTLYYQLSNTAESINDKLYVSPFLNEIIKENPLKQPSRTYPIDMIYPVEKQYISSFEIPDGYQIDYRPADYSFDSEDFKIRYKMDRDDNLVKISFSYYFKKPVYSARDYTKIKAYFNKIIEKGHEKIVLSKT